MDGESQIDTPARGPSPRPWAAHPDFREYIIPANHVGRDIGCHSEEAIDRDKYALVLATVRPYKTTYAHRIGKEEAHANRDLIVLAVNSYDAHLALMRRALEMADGLETACLKASTQAVLGTLADDLRAALAGAER